MTASPAVVRAVPEEQLECGSPSLLLAPAYRDVSLLHTRAYDIDGKRYSIKCFTRSPSDILDINFSRSRSPFASAYRRRATTEYDVYEEFKLHKRVSAHPNVVTAHRMLEEAHNLFLVLDHSPDCHFLDLLQERRNLKGSVLIKKAFLQLLDAVEHCHSLGVYHRNLRPDAIECFDDGQRLAITDFGIATTDKMSEERFVGGGRYMAPECREDGGIPVGALPGPYSPSSCDVWSLGIVLLNLIIGRNPWNSSTSEDPEFRLYRTTPPLFFAALPTSSAVNMLLARTLEVDWTQRITISEMRREVTEIKRFYSVRGAFALGIDQVAEWSEGSHSLARSRPAPNELSDKSSSDSETLSGSVVSPPHSSVPRSPPSSHSSHHVDSEMASDSPTESPPGARIGLNAEDSSTPAQPTEVDLGGGPSRLANTPNDSLVSFLPSPEPIHTSRSPASVPESKPETYWNVYNEHELDTSVLSLAQTVEDARSYQTIVSTSSDLHRVATDRAVHPATLNQSRTSLRPNPRFDFLAPIRIAFFRRLYVCSGAARRSQTSLETFSTRERRFSGGITEPDSEDLERYHSHSLDRALDASDVVIDHEHGDWRSINTMSTANVIYHSMFSE